MRSCIKVVRVDEQGGEKKLNSLVTVREMAELLDCTEQTVRAMARRKELPSVKIGSRVYIKRNVFIEQFCG